MDGSFGVSLRTMKDGLEDAGFTRAAHTGEMETGAGAGMEGFEYGSYDIIAVEDGFSWVVGRDGSDAWGVRGGWNGAFPGLAQWLGWSRVSKKVSN